MIVLPGGMATPKPVAGEGAADAEDDVGVVQELVHGPGNGAAARAEGEGVVLGEGALALEAGGDGDLEALGELAEFVPGFRVVDTLAGVDDGPLGVAQHLGNGTHGLGVGAGAEGGGGLVGEVVGNFLLEDVAGNLDEHGSRTAVAHLGEGAAHDIGNGRAEGDLLGPLGDVLEVEERVEIGGDVGEAAGVAAGHDEDGHGIAVGLGHTAEGVLRAGTVLHGEDADAIAGVDAAEGVGHVQADALLADDDRADVRARAAASMMGLTG